MGETTCGERRLIFCRFFDSATLTASVSPMNYNLTPTLGKVREGKVRWPRKVNARETLRVVSRVISRTCKRYRKCGTIA